jgi:4-hydroxybenzoate polyprenyltransferase
MELVITGSVRRGESLTKQKGPLPSLIGRGLNAPVRNWTIFQGKRMLQESPSAARAARPSGPLPLFVDLDGTLVQTNTLIENILSAIDHPGQLMCAIFSLRHGKAAMKQRISAQADLDPTLLPYNQDLLLFLKSEADAGRYLVLATGADRKIATAVADHLEVFDAVLASDGEVSLTGAKKLAAIRRMIGTHPFAYVGNDRKDLAIWREAECGIVVNAPPSFERAAARLTTIEAALARKTARLPALLRAMRLHQWVKNLLVFVPIITARAADDLVAWGFAGLTFVAFSLCSSGMYLLNDLRDLAADRQHPRKRHRPFASGALPLQFGFVASPLLLLSGIGLGMVVGVLPIILLYLLGAMAYSLYLKSRPLVDVFLLAALYSLRLFGGGVATGYRVSLWLLAFSSFLFLGLAMVKRVSELMTLSAKDSSRATGRGYKPTDAGILQFMGVASSFVASMVLALYMQSELNPKLGHYPMFSWALIPLSLFWQCRLWFSTARGHMHDDPIIFAARDWVSWLVAISAIAAFLFEDLISL